MSDSLIDAFHKNAKALGHASLRLVHSQHEHLQVRNDVADPFRTEQSVGLMVQVWDEGACGYAATSDASESGVRHALHRAAKMAQASKRYGVVAQTPLPTEEQSSHASTLSSWKSSGVKERLERCMSAQSSSSLKEIVNRQAGLWCIDEESHLVTTRGGDIKSHHSYMIPSLNVTASDDKESQTRTFGGEGDCLQGGMEVLDQTDFNDAIESLLDDARALLVAPNCPEELLTLMLHPDQMMLQIHESIGHPIELDRILGDERNFAGTSFVTLDMFGSYQYGSSLLNVTFDPTDAKQFASYSHDDEGQAAAKTFLIEDGVLKRGIGGVLSQKRSGIEGVAASRASGWNRAPIDRMSNLNIEKGQSSFEDMIQKIERGVYMRTNRSWSIDDSRNKFQFGCEVGQMIENGRLTHLVKNPNYRGVSADFWRSLSAVGDGQTHRTLGTPFCGKGEPNQLIRVGHASPTCVFDNINVFGAS